MNCLIIDDEDLAIDVIKKHVERIPFLNLITTTTSAFEAIEIIESQQIDLLFIDIQMPELTGLELLKSLSIYFRKLCWASFNLLMVHKALKGIN